MDKVVLDLGGKPEQTERTRIWHMENNLVIRISNSGKALIDNRKFVVRINEDLSYTLNKEKSSLQIKLLNGNNKIVVCENDYSQEKEIYIEENQSIILTVNPSSKKLETIFTIIFTIFAVIFIIYILKDANLIGPALILTMIPITSLIIYFSNLKNDKESFALTLKNDKNINTQLQGLIQK